MLKEFSNTCPNDRYTVLLTNKHKRVIVDWHNVFRNKIATGQIKGYEPAVRMPMLVCFFFKFNYIIKLSFRIVYIFIIH